MDLSRSFEQAAELVAQAKALVVTAGAGMGVDSGLPDFRGDQGFWTAYPLYQRLGISFVDAANPEHFERDPRFGWGFYGHRTNLYRETVPHPGFQLLLDWAKRCRLDCFVATSNVDGQFQKAGFAADAVLEFHGSIHHLQCTRPCSSAIWENREEFRIDTETMRADHVPLCPRCGSSARPNILMFGDYCWIDDRTMRQQERFRQFLSRQGAGRIVVVEMGAGTAIPTVRAASERIGALAHGRVIRINPREPQISKPHLSLPCGALEGLNGIEEMLRLRSRP
ncbi:NAD-dependent protein deacetylase, Sir2 family [Citrifermentans bemidjiense Bem]|uniref:protein acetyllysine N-acetyltransferase n=1 Tax=Citrifermentans bemidjiense (strain ATCC BAA-1014 / DSM 16622 / JCM 12645 / Bem) TaxID=404380 RepID=B5EIB0_CITBB|nr:Sir2 family NAD-dependent protein deacetylase [Citrifermentans bemidjiense]ACH39812.1 NAD-dependent protein deacetylase, Sir2 family [Citrifermentans bemidjiense Bem]